MALQTTEINDRERQVSIPIHTGERLSQPEIITNQVVLISKLRPYQSGQCKLLEVGPIIYTLGS
jgi:hypothetical protein